MPERIKSTEAKILVKDLETKYAGKDREKKSLSFVRPHQDSYFPGICSPDFNELLQLNRQKQHKDQTPVSKLHFLLLCTTNTVTAVEIKFLHAGGKLIFIHQVLSSRIMSVYWKGSWFLHTTFLSFSL